MTNDAAWTEWRAGGVGSSDVAAAYSGRYGGAYKAVASRLGIAVDEIDEALADRGHRWEQSIADGIHAHTGYYVGAEQVWLEHAGNRRHRATPDGLLFSVPNPEHAHARGVMEIKTRGAYAPWPWDYWTAQAQWLMHVAQVPRCLLAVVTIDDEYDPTSATLTERVTDIQYRWLYADQFLQNELVELADWLLELIDSETMPDPVSPDALPYVKAANKIADPDATADIDDIADLIERYEDLKAAAKMAADEADIAQAKIRDRMGEATEATTSDGVWRVRCGAPVRKFTSTSENDFIDLYCMHGPDCAPDCADHRPDLLTAKLARDIAKDEMPDEYDALRIPTPDRRLTIKKLED